MSLPRPFASLSLASSSSGLPSCATAAAPDTTAPSHMPCSATCSLGLRQICLRPPSPQRHLFAGKWEARSERRGQSGRATKNVNGSERHLLGGLPDLLPRPYLRQGPRPSEQRGSTLGGAILLQRSQEKNVTIHALSARIHTTSQLPRL